MEGATPINALPPPQTSRDQTTSNYNDILKALEAETYAEPPPPQPQSVPMTMGESGGGGAGFNTVDPHTAELHRQLQELRADMRHQHRHTAPPKTRGRASGQRQETEDERHQAQDTDDDVSFNTIRTLLSINRYTIIVMIIIFVLFKFGAPRLAALSPRMFVSPSGRLNLIGTAAVSILGGMTYKASTLYA